MKKIQHGIAKFKKAWSEENPDLVFGLVAIFYFALLFAALAVSYILQ